METTTVPEGLQAQRQYIEKLESEHFGWDILVGDAFVRGMRDIGYKSTSFAMAELIDNAIQAAASRVDIVFGFDGGAKPTKIAIIDNGHGMEAKMVRASLIWGAGTRAENREGFGKYGYGLPSASVSQCHRVSVFSKIPGGEWHRAYLDIDEIKDGKWSKGNRIEMPAAAPMDPPDFVLQHLEERGRSGDHGTVVVWEGLDRVNPKLRQELRNSLVTNLGVIYRNYLVATPITVDCVDVQPCDPLFLTEGFRYYDLDEDRAVELPPATVEVKDKGTGQVIGRMRVRYARMPATFFRKPEFKHTNRPGKGGTNERLDIADANNGIIFLRNGRQIDVIRPPRSMRSINATTDRFWAVEVNFDATLDELFSITTSKQQVRPDDSVWDMLKDKAKLFDVIGEMFTTYKKDASKIATKAEQAKEGKRASVEAIEGAAKFRTTKTPDETPERQQEAEANLEQEARKRAGKAGVKPEAIERELVAEREGRTHEVETEDMPGAPFMRCVQEGGTRVLYLNIAHPFYTELYAGPSATPRLRAGLEVLLWTLGNSEADADPESERRRFYERERVSVWSPQLADALQVLKGVSVMESEVEEAEAGSAA
ncbi:MAG: ATP-binding protein [Actinomycetota bacterium]|nr:ATP-binding protein [Actinomycetota bacterium]